MKRPLAYITAAVTSVPYLLVSICGMNKGQGI